MIHKESLLRVDLFTPRHQDDLVEITLSEIFYQAVSLEGQILCIARDLFQRISAGVEVKEKSLDKLTFLFSRQCLNWAWLLKLYASEQLFYWEPAYDKVGRLEDAGLYVRSAIQHAVEFLKKPPASTKLKPPSVVTSNGITVDDSSNPN